LNALGCYEHFDVIEPVQFGFPVDALDLYDSLAKDVQAAIQAASAKAGKTGKILARIGGVLTSDRRDLQGETIDQRGIDWSYFLQKGWINDVHDKSTGGGIGYPTKVWMVKLPSGRVGHRFEGVLLDCRRARDIVDLHKALDGHPRNLSFSIQGAVAARASKDKGDPGFKHVLKMIPIDASMTRHNVNLDAEVDLLEPIEKSFDAVLERLQKDLTAGCADTTYSGGGSGGPLMVPGGQGNGNSRRGKRMKRDVLVQVFGKDEVEKAIGALEAAGFDLTQPVAIEKSLDAPEMAAALSDVRDCLAKGGSVVLKEAMEAEEVVQDASGTLRATLEALQKVHRGQEALAKGFLAIAGKLTTSDLRLDGFKDALEKLDKSLDKPVAPVAVRPGTVVERATEQPDEFPKERIRKSLDAEMMRCTKSGDFDRGAKAGHLMRAIESVGPKARCPVTKADLEALGIPILE
jgi:hypothetical protein